MPRGGAITFGDLDGTLLLGVLRVSCSKCDRKGRYHLTKLIEEYGRDGRLVDWKESLTADCPRRASDRAALHDICGAHFPDLLVLF